MAKLTEEMVVARSRQSDLASVKKLNCWGAELVDVSLLRRMPNVEVLALSVNNITSLADFAYCSRLRELYIRKNQVRQLSEIRHLQRLPALTQLWLEENPCSERPDYRLTVLRNLPNLEKLDNVAVNSDELEEAMRRGALFADPEDEEYAQEHYSRESSPEPEHYRRDQSGGGGGGWEGADTTYTETSNGNRRSSQSEQASPARREYSPEPDDRYEYPPPHSQQCNHPHGQPQYNNPHSQTQHNQQRQSPPHPPRTQYYERGAEAPGRLSHASSADEPITSSSDKARIRHSQSAQSVKQEYSSNGDGGGSRHAPANYRHSADYHNYDTHSDRSESYREAARCECGGGADSPARREEVASAVMAERRGFTRRPLTRTSNLLSAVLCLIKELDYPSLEVAEMAVRCRMDELANQGS